MMLQKRAAFYICTRNQNESVGIFYTRLKRASENCLFGAYISDMLRDRLVLESYNTEAKRKILRIVEVTLEIALSKLQSYETVEL